MASNSNQLQTPSPEQILERSRDTRPYTLPERLGRRLLQTGQMIIGRKEALAGLALNIRNRRMDMNRAAEYCRIMLNGHWTINNDAICFTNQDLANGQTRLMAVFLASETKPDIEVPFNVIVGLAPHPNYDGPRVRSGAQNLQLAEFDRASALAAAARLLVQYYNEVEAIPETSLLYLPSARTHCSVNKIMHAVETYPELQTSLNFVTQLRNHRSVVTPNVLTVMHHLAVEAANEVDASDAFIDAYPDFAYGTEDCGRQIADEFIGRLVDGVNLRAGTPLLSLREKLLRIKKGAQGKGSTTLPTDKLAMCIRTWNAWRADPTASFRKVYGLSTDGKRVIKMPTAS